MGMTLYEIDEEYKELQDIIEDLGGEIPEELEAKLDAIVSDRNKKIENILKFIRNLESFEKLVEIETAKLKKKQESLSKKSQSLRNYLAAILGEGNKWKSTVASITWGKSDSVEVLDKDKISPDYKTTETIINIDKIGIKRDLKAGIEVKGVELKTKMYMKIY